MQFEEKKLHLYIILHLKYFIKKKKKKEGNLQSTVYIYMIMT